MERKNSAAAIALMLILTMSSLTTFLPLVQAPSTEVVPTWIEASAEPSLVGVGQTVYINAFITKPIATTGFGSPGDLYQNITVVLVTPTGKKETYGPYQADATGGIWFTYTPDTAGNYTVQAFYGGQVLTYGTTYNGMTYLPSESTIVMLTVQQEPIPPGYSTPPLPTEYWSRPIFATNYAWANDLGSNWFQPGRYDGAGVVDPYAKTAPRSGHVVWTKPVQFGGQPGDIPADQGSVYFSQSFIASYWSTPIILNGIGYFVTYTGTGGTLNWTAIDIRTGEILWTTPRGLTGSENFKCGQIWKWHSWQEYGAAAVLWATAGSEFHIYDALTGAWLANITNAVTGASFIQDFSDYTTEQGTIYAWYTTTNSTGTYLNMWNSTRCIAYSRASGFGSQVATPGSGNWPSAGAPQYEMNYRVTPSGALNWTCGIQYWTQINTTLNGAPVALTSVTYSFSDLGKDTKKILLLRSSGTIASQSSNGYQLTMGIDALTGNVLWGPLNQTIPKYHDIGFIGARNGTYVLRDKDTMEAYGYSLVTGSLTWGPIELPANAWSHLATSGWLDDSRAYVIDYGGYVNAINLQTGDLDWTWHTDDAGYNTPYGVYELWVQGQMAEVAGLIYVFEGKLYDPPMSANESIICLDSLTGELVWSGLGYCVKNVPAFADGYMIDYNSYDKQMYTFGKGQTATTAIIENDVTTFGHKVVVKGMVTDESAGTKDTDRVARFPQGVPAVSEESMRDWMAYVYSQQVKPADATGVPVTITVYDPNGNTYEVGTVTSDGDGFYTLAFDPPVAGEYVVTATFGGSESYWGSSAKTSVFVEEAPAASSTPTPPPASMTDTYVTGFGIGIIIAIVAVGLLLFVVLRKR